MLSKLLEIHVFADFMLQFQQLFVLLVVYVVYVLCFLIPYYVRYSIAIPPDKDIILNGHTTQQHYLTTAMFTPHLIVIHVCHAHTHELYLHLSTHVVIVALKKTETAS